MRLATYEVKPLNDTQANSPTDTALFIRSPKVSVPDATVVGVALNG